MPDDTPPPESLRQALATAPVRLERDPRIEAKVEKSPSMAVGENLALWVLGVASGAILVLFLYLFTIDLTIGRELASLYKHTDKPCQPAEVRQASEQLDQLSEHLTAAAKPRFVLPADAKRSDLQAIGSLATILQITPMQKELLLGCVSGMSTRRGNRANLGECHTIIENYTAGGFCAALNELSDKKVADSAGRLNDNRDTVHKFWLQAAQLILLNLLLPVLTAILGYTFGNQEAQRRSNEDK